MKEQSVQYTSHFSIHSMQAMAICLRNGFSCLNCGISRVLESCPFRCALSMHLCMVALWLFNKDKVCWHILSIMFVSLLQDTKVMSTWPHSKGGLYQGRQPGHKNDGTNELAHSYCVSFDAQISAQQQREGKRGPEHRQKLLWTEWRGYTGNIQTHKR